MPSTEAFESFLGSFKSTPVSALASAIDGMNIDEDDFSDDYDFMEDDDDEEEPASTRRRPKPAAKQPTLKYVELLQKIADRVEDEITIDLDDLAKVCKAQIFCGMPESDMFCSTTELWRIMELPCTWWIRSKRMQSTT